MITLLIGENNFELHEKIATLISEHAEEIRLVSIEKCSDASFDGIMIISDVGGMHGAAMSARIVSRANSIYQLSVGESLGKIEIVGFGSRCGNEHLVSIFTDQILDKQFRVVESVDRTANYKFSDVRKFPLLRQCKNAQKNYSPGMRKR
jgi:hypothetical protein